MPTDAWNPYSKHTIRASHTPPGTQLRCREPARVGGERELNLTLIVIAEGNCHHSPRCELIGHYTETGSWVAPEGTETVKKNCAI
jgi:hypothetical protein